MNTWERVRYALGRMVLGRRFHVSQTPPGWVDKLAGTETASGVYVDEEGSLQATAVWACVRVIAETVASLPLHLYRRRSGGGRERATEHPLYELLHSMPNPEMGALEFREALTGHLCTWGNAYAEIEYNRGGNAMALWPLRPDRMQVKREQGRLWYYYRVDQVGTPQRLPAERIWHLRGFGANGVMGYSPILLHKQAVGLSLATEEFGARFFGNGAEPGGVLQHPGKVSDTGAKHMRESWEDAHKGLSRSHRIAILEEGVTYQKVGIEPEAAQFLETRKFQLVEVARIYRMQPHMIGDLDRATFSNIEHQGLEFVMYTMMPWFVRWEQGVHRNLLTPAERRQYFAEYLVDALLRGDTQSRYAAYAVARQNGWMNADEIRERENMNPLPDGQGQIYLVPMNMIPASQAGAGLGSSEQPPEPPAGEDEAPAEDGERALVPPGNERSYEQRAAKAGRARHRLEQAHRPLYVQTMARILRREKNDVGAQAKKLLSNRSQAEFNLWLESFYEEHQRWAFDQIRPLTRSYAQLVAAAVDEELGQTDQELTPQMEDWIRSYLAAWAARHGAISRAAIQRAIDKAIEMNLDPGDHVAEMLDGWPDGRASTDGMNEAVRFNNGLAKALYVLAGVIKLRWSAFGESCPYCSSLDGVVVGVDEVFIKAGQEFQPDGAQAPLKPGHNVGHAPAHDGCDCMVMAGR